jgi:type VI secretion system protein ImpC
MTEVAAARDLASCFRGPPAATWEAFRDSPEARFVALTLPRILARAPYGAGDMPVAEFPFEEFVEGAGPRELCWMSAAWALVERVAAAQAREGWPARIFGPVGGKVEGLPLGDFPAEAALSGSRAPELAGLGLLPLVRGSGGEAFFAGPATCRRPAVGETADRLDALLCAARFVHYLSTLARDRTGDPAEVKECERWLNRWLAAFVVADPGTASPDVLTRQPLAEARVELRLAGDRSRAFEVVAWLRPCHALPAPHSTFHFVAKVPRRM